MDATHPDLKDRVEAAKNFSESADTTDRTARKVVVQVSCDDGKHWKKAKVVAGEQRIRLSHPARPGTVSLRVSLTDPKGGTTKQTIYRAYRTTK